jgi:hypothetical protein
MWTPRVGLTGGKRTTRPFDLASAEKTAVDGIRGSEVRKTADLCESPPMQLTAGLALAALGLTLGLSVTSGCGDPPPSGKPVDLAPDERIDSFGARSLWWSWHAKGMKERLMGRHQEALFCFLKAEKAWPRTLPPGEETLVPPNAIPGAPAPPHRPVPMETLIVVAELYSFLRQPQWALAVLDVIDKEIDKGTTYTRALRVETLAKYPKTKAAIWPR